MSWYGWYNIEHILRPKNHFWPPMNWFLKTFYKHLAPPKFYFGYSWEQSYQIWFLLKRYLYSFVETLPFSFPKPFPSWAHGWNIQKVTITKIKSEFCPWTDVLSNETVTPSVFPYTSYDLHASHLGLINLSCIYVYKDRLTICKNCFPHMR